jgi:hypothetical protein
MAGLPFLASPEGGCADLRPTINPQGSPNRGLPFGGASISIDFIVSPERASPPFFR